MKEKTVEERLAALETVSHIHADPLDKENPNPLRIIDNIDCNPIEAAKVRAKLKKDAETQRLSESDVLKAKAGGKIHGDPIIEF